MERFRFANKPGIVPGKPITMGEKPAINALKQVARIDGHQHGVRLDYRRVTRTGASLVIGACDTGAAEKGRFDQTGRIVRFRMGGAY